MQKDQLQMREFQVGHLAKALELYPEKQHLISTLTLAFPTILFMSLGLWVTSFIVQNWGNLDGRMRLGTAIVLPMVIGNVALLAIPMCFF
jgi:hypothetical protein